MDLAEKLERIGIRGPRVPDYRIAQETDAAKGSEGGMCDSTLPRSGAVCIFRSRVALLPPTLETKPFTTSEVEGRIPSSATPTPQCYHFSPDRIPCELGAPSLSSLVVVVIARRWSSPCSSAKHAPPEAARLLPGADAFIYADLAWVRKANAGKELPPVSHDPEYERFIRETGFQFERDLDEAAFAVHYPASWPGGGTGGSAPELRFSEVLEGRFQGERLTAYLRQIAKVGRELSLGRYFHHSFRRQVFTGRGAERRFGRGVQSRRPCRYSGNR